MKTLILSAILFSSSSIAGYGKPELLARYSGVKSFNAPEGLYCFSSEPEPTKEGIYLSCQNHAGVAMVRWTPNFEVVSQSPDGLFSHPKEVEGKTSWYEFNEAGVKRLFEVKNNSLRSFNISNLAPGFPLIDAFIPVKGGSYVYRMQTESTKSFNIWKERNLSTLNIGEAAHLFPPVSSQEGVLLAKIRRNTINDTAPDELVIWDGEAKTILRDRDADPTSKIKSFRHQYALDKGAAAVIVTDDRGEALVIVRDGRQVEVARAGVHLASFDYFAPKMKNGVLVFRGVDFQKRKVVYVYENHVLRPLLTQGDTVLTDLGVSRIHYQDQDAIFYGAPGISAHGTIYQQATLTDPNASMTLHGIGLLRLLKE